MKPTGQERTGFNTWVVREAPDFIQGLANAMRKDLESIGSTTGQDV